MDFGMCFSVDASPFLKANIIITFKGVIMRKQKAEVEGVK